MNPTTHPLAWRLSPDSTSALLFWCVLVAQANPNTITPQTLARLAQGDQYERKARARLLLCGLGRS